MYIQTTTPNNAQGKLADLYARYANPDGTVDAVLQAHSVSPDSLAAHAQLYVQAMHRPCPLSRIERELIGVEVSRINECHY